ncbi:hypothetical protein Esti_005092 [Eimeria stiedai]
MLWTHACTIGNSSWIFECVDVGGGRGHLAFALAAAFPRMRVKVVEAHEPSVLALRLRLQQQQQQQEQQQQRGEDLGQQIIPVHADFWAAQESLGAPDLLVALHACGGLSDAVVSAAVSLRASFLVCSCCLSKHASMRAHTLTPRLMQCLPVAAGAPLCLVCAPFILRGPCPHGALSHSPSPHKEILEGAQENRSNQTLTHSREATDDPSTDSQGEAPHKVPSNSAVPDDAALRLLFRQDEQTAKRLADSTDPAIGFKAMWGALAWRAAAAVLLAGPAGGRPPQGAPSGGPEGPPHAEGPPVSALKCKLLSFPSSFSQKNLVLLGVFDPPSEVQKEGAPKEPHQVTAG